MTLLSDHTMATTATRRYNPDSYYQTEIVYDDFDDIQQGPSRRSPIKTISYNPEHQFPERQDDSVPKYVTVTFFSIRSWVYIFL